MNIKLEKFEGPLSLLLRLIEKEEMDITEISLAKIADQYIEYIRSLSKTDSEEMADFLVVAARLLLIKSKALLPYLYPEEEREIEELEQQLRMYKEFLDAAKKVQALIGRKKFMFAREFNRKAILANIHLFSPPKKLTARDLAAVFQEIIGGLRPIEKLEEEKLEHKINIEDKISAIQNMLINRIKISFSKVMAGAGTKTEVIVIFLAMLELIKQRDITAEQSGLFEEILINKI
ncbi:segregation/condensation protein A [Patescibacteria group bacterium]|nr:segregation/condensation protein A [Patescibacteria group bacterium]MBU4347717.1 segregation/condensation protein A [Patescibacteria group bacterium]MBU4455104.1 segregation/condensation protein A [Patescibacteria group bacterium]MCG2690871.1 segregation/condensation protein A [Candidatus Parcubacteria bacterium]